MPQFENLNDGNFGRVVVGAKTLAASDQNAVLTLVAGTNITLTPVDTTNTVTISATSGGGTGGGSSQVVTEIVGAFVSSNTFTFAATTLAPNFAVFRNRVIQPRSLYSASADATKITVVFAGSVNDADEIVMYSIIPTVTEATASNVAANVFEFNTFFEMATTILYRNRVIQPRALFTTSVVGNKTRVEFLATVSDADEIILYSTVPTPTEAVASNVAPNVFESNAIYDMATAVVFRNRVMQPRATFTTSVVDNKTRITFLADVNDADEIIIYLTA
jgi:hypothetical protein